MGTSINDLRNILTSVLGFEQESGKDHVRFVLIVKGEIVARTKISHSGRGNAQIDDTILSLIAKQLHCSNRTLKGLLQRRLSKEDYLREILENGRIDQSKFDLLCGK